ncbi:PhzF family phenazine biosynthesis protein [Dialister succinatiphilus]|uniref:PhzF family phenazine biosynthesis protein n=1 Tax=Dialister succinatiphilus TaxID=487173 RepID=UPI003F81C306
MKQYIADAFTDEIFKGNQAAVCVMDKWPFEDTMMHITMENNFSETAFMVKEENGHYRLRWFTPGGEIDLCGHATLASGYILFRFYEKDKEEVVFDTMSGPLTVARKEDLYVMDFPAYELKQVPVTDEMEEAIGVRPLEAWMGRDLLCVLPTEEDVRNAEVDQEKVKKLDGLLLHITARGKKWDSVSRSFAPKLLVPEDPVCGSGHCHIVPYWSKKLGKKEILAYQASRRIGILHCRMEGNRVRLGGRAALYSIAEIADTVKGL